MAENRAFYKEQLKKPSVQKLLKAIRFAEGTAGPKGYQTMFGGGTFSDMSRHPDKVIRSGKYASAAAGAYQFMPGTWQGAASKLGLKSFNPTDQDIAGAYLAHERLKGIGGFARLDKEGLSPQIAAALAPEWASFPTLSGSSYYGQPVKRLKEIQKVYGDFVPTAGPETTIAQAKPETKDQPVTQVPNQTIVLLGGKDSSTDDDNLNYQFLQTFLGTPERSSSASRSARQSLLENMLSSISGTTSSPNYFSQTTM